MVRGSVVRGSVSGKRSCAKGVLCNGKGFCGEGFCVKDKWFCEKGFCGKGKWFCGKGQWVLWKVVLCSGQVVLC